MPEIKIDKIIRSKRKTIALIVTPEATLVVRAPFKTQLAYIEKLVRQKRTWIQEKQARFQRTYHKAQPKEFVNGEGFLYLGKEYKLDIVNNQDQPVILDGNLKIAQACLSQARAYLIAWYKDQALQKITKRVEWYAKQAGLAYRSVKITNAQKRYGSCGTKGTLNFSWRLIMAPLRVLDYVVVHELAHLDEKNHSRKFWNKVKVTLPDYRDRQEWLKENGGGLSV